MRKGQLRSQFFIPFSQSGPVYYFDSAATSLRLKEAMDAVVRFYQQYNSNIHRSTNLLATNATRLFEDARQKIASFIDKEGSGKVIFTQNTTDSINQIAFSFGRKVISRGDTVLLTEFEHHSNLLPWIKLCREKEAKLVHIPYDPDKDTFVNRGLDLISKHRPKILALSTVSNTLGYVTPHEPLCAKVKELGGFVVTDCAQAVQHMRPDPSFVDFIAFSSHKVFAPFGVGVLWARNGLLEDCEPLKVGGGTITDTDFGEYKLAELPYKFEAGTQPIAEVIGLGTAIDWLEKNLTEWQEQEAALKEHFLKRISEFPDIRILNDSPDIPLFSLYSDGDLTALNFHLASRGFCLRLGHHCAIPIHKKFGLNQSLRVSLAGYNTVEEVDRFFETLSEISRRKMQVALNGLKISNEDTGVNYAEKLNGLSDDELVEYLIYLGSKNPKPSQEYLSEENLVKGCMSKVYVWGKDEHPFFDGWSETPTLNGLLQLLKNVSVGMSSERLKGYDFMALLDSTNVFKALTTNRRFGIANLVERIRFLVNS